MANRRITAQYDKVITACCFLFLFVNMGFTSTSISVYQPYIAALPGVGDMGASAILATRSAVSFLTLMVVDRLIELLGVRRSAALACVLTAAAFACYGMANGMPGFLLGAVLAGVSYGYGGMVCMTVLLNRWFANGVGSAIGVATVGSGAASVVIPLMATGIIQRAGLSAALFAEACLALAISVAVYALVRNSPKDLGLEPFRVTERPGRQGRSAHRCSAVPVPGGIRRGMYAATFLMGCSAIGGTAFMSIFMTSKGFDVVFAGLLVSGCGLCLAVGKVAAGSAFDRLGGMRASSAFFLMMLAGLACCCLAAPQVAPLAVLGVALFGAGSSLATVGVSVWSLELTDASHRQKDVKGFQAAFAAGGIAFNLLPGALMTAFGSYTVSYVLMLVCLMGCAALVLRAYTWRGRSELR